MRRNKLLLWSAIVLIVLGLGTGAVIGYRAYKIAEVRKVEDRLADWMVTGVMNANPVKFVTDGGNQPNWMGDTAVFSLLETPTGARIAVNASIRSSLTETRIVRLELYYRDGAPIENMSPAELAKTAQHPSGITVGLPADIVYSDKPLDLQKELPIAFGNATR